MKLMRTEKTYQHNTVLPVNGICRIVTSYYDGGYKIIKKYRQDSFIENHENGINWGLHWAFQNFVEEHADKIKWKLVCEQWCYNKNWNSNFPPEEISLTLTYSSTVSSYTSYLSSAKWSMNGKLHRNHGHAVTEYITKNSTYLSTQIWLRNGIRFRGQCLPANISYYPNGQVSRACWVLNGYHNDDKSYRYHVHYNVNGEVECIDSPRFSLWSPDGPNSILISHHGNIEHESWMNGGWGTRQWGWLPYHRENGPAKIEYEKAIAS